MTSTCFLPFRKYLRKNMSCRFVFYYLKIKFKENKSINLFFSIQMYNLRKIGHVNLFFYYLKIKVMENRSRPLIFKFNEKQYFITSDVILLHLELIMIHRKRTLGKKKLTLDSIGSRKDILQKELNLETQCNPKTYIIQVIITQSFEGLHPFVDALLSLQKDT